MEPKGSLFDFLEIVQRYGVLNKDVPLTTLEWSKVAFALMNEPKPGELGRVFSLDNDSFTLKPGVSGWEVVKNADPFKPSPTQVRKSRFGNLLPNAINIIPPQNYCEVTFPIDIAVPHGVIFNGGNNLLEITPDGLEHFHIPGDGTWVNSRYVFGVDGLYHLAQQVVSLDPMLRQQNLLDARRFLKSRSRLIITPTRNQDDYECQIANAVGESQSALLNNSMTILDPDRSELYIDRYDDGIINVELPAKEMKTIVSSPKSLLVPIYPFPSFDTRRILEYIDSIAQIFTQT